MWQRFARIIRVATFREPALSVSVVATLSGAYLYAKQAFAQRNQDPLNNKRNTLVLKNIFHNSFEHHNPYFHRYRDLTYEHAQDYFPTNLKPPSSDVSNS